ncbi:MAG: diaminopimelate epimerase [Candidatus Omnitrophica bacterium]|nr:diaminopimelate epimerase [Candidatus Omnitrophota bacterium]
MKRVTFYKMQASGNDFIVIDNRRGVVKNAASFARRVSPRCTSVGADGVLLAERSKRADLRMRIINADGSEPAMCGNGLRCFALFAYRMLRFPSSLTIETGAGLARVRVSGSLIRVQMMRPRSYKTGALLTAGGRKWKSSFVNTGVPHVVFFVKSFNGFSIKDTGRTIRWHRRFKPAGTNVNFVIRKDKHSLINRTYERGVEDETLACGTGSTAAAVVAVLKNLCESPVRVKTRGGEVLTVSLKRDGNKISEVYLEGKASFVYEGVLRIAY